MSSILQLSDAKLSIIQLAQNIFVCLVLDFVAPINQYQGNFICLMVFAIQIENH